MQLTLRYPRLEPDVIAGLTCSLFVIPVAMAYASLAGLTVQAGLYAAVAGLAAYAVLGSTPVLKVTVTLTVAILTSDAIVRGDIRPEDAAAAAPALAVVAGLVLLAAAVFKLGFLSSVICRPVFYGLKAGLAVWIFTSQIGNVLGFPIQMTSFSRGVSDIFNNLDSTDPVTVAFVAASVGLIVVAYRFRDKAPSYLTPAPLLLVVFGLGATLFGLDNHGLALVAPVSSELPRISVPSLDHLDVLWPAMICVALIALIESAGAARQLSSPRGPAVLVDREALALGVANIGSAFFGGMPASGDRTQAALEAETGPQSRRTLAVLAVAALVSATLLGDLFTNIPQATLSLIIITSLAGFVDIEQLRGLARASRRDSGLALAAALGVVVFAPVNGVFIAAALSIGLLLYELNHPPIYRVALDSIKANGHALAALDEVLAVKLEGPLYFANAEHIAETVLRLAKEARPEPNLVIVDCAAVTTLDQAATTELSRLSQDLREQGMQLWLAGLNHRAREAIDSFATGSMSTIRMPASLHAALRAYQLTVERRQAARGVA